MRWDAKVDRNQAQIVAELRQLGFDVDIVHREKKLYDLVVSGKKIICDGTVCCTPICAVRVEIKMPGCKLTPDEDEYWQKQNHPECLIIAESSDDVLRWFGRIE